MALVCRRRRAALVPEADPDLTSMIDCVFLLLVFFMVTTVFIHTRGLDVDLPTDSQSMHKQDRKDINLTVDARGRMQLRGVDVAPAQLEARIRRAMAETGNDNLMILAHPDCAQEHVVGAVDAAKAAGTAGIAFVRETSPDE